MAWSKIDGTVTQIMEANVAANGYVVKFYDAGTTTPQAVATDDTGGTTATNFLINSEGYITHSGSEIIPHTQSDYKIVLYLNQADADADDTGSAVYIIDNVQGAANATGSVTVTDIEALGDGEIIIGSTAGNVSNAISNDATLASTGALTIANSAINAAKLATDAVETAKIKDANVTLAKLASDVTGTLDNVETLISTTTITATSAINITLDTATYRDFRIEVEGVSPAAAAEFCAQFLHSSQATAYSANYKAGWKAQATGSSSTGQSRLRFTGNTNVTTSGTYTLSGTIKLKSFNETTTPYTTYSDIAFTDNSGTDATMMGAWNTLNVDQTDTVTNPQVDGIRFGWNASSFGDTNFDANGKIKLFGTLIQRNNQCLRNSHS